MLTSHSAEWTALRLKTMPSAPARAIGPSTQKTTVSPPPSWTRGVGRGGEQGHTRSSVTGSAGDEPGTRR